VTAFAKSDLWRIRVDTGGTFTDCVAIDPAGRTVRAKVLSSSSLRGTLRDRPAPLRLEIDLAWVPPDGFFAGCSCRPLAAGGREVEVRDWDAGARVLELVHDPGPIEPGGGLEIRFREEAPILAARVVTSTPVGSPLPPIAMRLATTRGTNALLERHGADVALFITRGFGDLLRIGTQQRPELFRLDVRRPRPFHGAVVEVDERLAADGSVVRELDEEGVRERAAELAAAGFEVGAIALAHSYRNPEHERRVAAIVADCGFRHLSLSSELAPFAGLLPRAETAVIDAYLAPIVEDYLKAVGDALETGSLHVMTSAGGLVRASEYRARDSLLSGPAGGVVGAARAGRGVGRRRLIAFDMGGTSTDAARIDGEYEYLYETRLGGARLLAPTLAIESVAAGGGSICAFERDRLRVGPESSGAVPGPACYGAGGPLSLTDVNLLLGRLDPDRFEIPIDRVAARQAAAELLRAVRAGGDSELELETLLEGLLRIADERMADAIRTISVRRGYDPAEYALVAFGGAGGQHACAVAELLGTKTVVVPADASLLSAHGLGGARIERFAQSQVLASLAEVESRLEEEFARLARSAVAAVAAEGVEAEAIEVRRRSMGLRLQGQDTTLEVPFAAGREVAAEFAAAYGRVYGYPPPDRPIEVESLRAVASSLEPPLEQSPEGVARHRAQPVCALRAWFDGAWRETPRFERATLGPGAQLSGPALVFERHSTTTVLPGWRLGVAADGGLMLERGAADEVAGGGEAG
jgi:5-oxoprolinase (ATP-hydrolysing)